MKKIKITYSASEIISIIERKLKATELQLNSNYQTEEYYTDKKSKLEILKEILSEIKS